MRWRSDKRASVRPLTHSLFRILNLLDEERLYYRVDRYRPDTVTIILTVVAERLEIDVFEDGHIEFCRFRGSEAPEVGGARLEQIIRQHGQKQNVSQQLRRSPFPNIKNGEAARTWTSSRKFSPGISPIPRRPS